MAKRSIDGKLDWLQGAFTSQDGLRLLLQRLADAGMRQEASAHLGAGRHERR